MIESDVKIENNPPIEFPVLAIYVGPDEHLQKLIVLFDFEYSGTVMSVEDGVQDYLLGYHYDTFPSVIQSSSWNILPKGTIVTIIQS